MSNTLKFTINIDGNAYTGIAELDDAMKALNVSAKGTKKTLDSFSAIAFRFDNITKGIQNFSNGIQEAIRPGIALNSSLSDLSAVAGVTGDGLKEIEGYARDTAKTFGLDAAQAVESYKLILSQLSPEIAKNPVAMNEMGNAIATLSKTMGGDSTAAAEVLTTAMNQYGVSLDDPMEASRKMAEMMNVMAAAGKEGSAELPTIKTALEQCGMAAKAAGVSFEETNAAIQVLDKAGKKGSEGGVALRNTLSTLAQGRFLPEDVQLELKAAGVDINKLGNKSLSLSRRLAMLKPVMKDTALFSKLFGRENANAAMALVQGTVEIDRYREAITGTDTAYQQAEIVMESYAEKQARIEAKFNDIKVSIFNATGNLGIWTDTLAKSLVPLSQLMPLLSSTRNLIQNIGKSNTFRSAVVATTLRLNIMKMSIANAGGMFGFLKKTGVSACRAIGVAISSIPIIGWIAAAVAALAALFKLLWDKSEGFRRFLFGMAEVFKAIWSTASALFSKIWSWVSGIFSSLKSWISDILSSPLSQVSDVFSNLWSRVSDFFSKIWNWVSGVFQSIHARIGGVFSWIGGVFSKVGAWFSKVMQPVADWFSNLWQTVKSIFGRIVEFMGNIFNPIIELWNKITGKITAKYTVGAEKGSVSFNKDKKDGTEGNFIADAHIPGISKKKDGSKIQDVAFSSTNAIASGGKRNTQITINLGKMADITFNGGVKENTQELTSQLEEILLRILYSAQSA